MKACWMDGDGARVAGFHDENTTFVSGWVTFMAAGFFRLTAGVLTIFLCFCDSV